MAVLVTAIHAAVQFARAAGLKPRSLQHLQPPCI